MEPTATQPQVDNVTPQTETVQKIKVKYNHEEKELPIDEVKVLAQKGMNYDKLSEKLQKYESDPGLKWLNEKAAQFGVSVPDLIAKWDSDLAARQASEIAEAKGIPEDVAHELLQIKTERDLTKQELEVLRAYKEEQERIDNQIKEFQKAYPDVPLDKIPEQVIETAKSEGVSLKVAYKAYLADVLAEEKKKLEEQLNVKKVNDENAATSMGSAKSTGDSNTVELTLDVIKSMTSEQRKANMGRILDYLKKHKT
jgi:hypothetical protein